MSKRSLGLALLMTALMVASAFAVPASRTILEKGLSTAAADVVEILPSFPDTFTSARDLGPLPSSTDLTVGVSLAPSNPGAADAYVYSMYAPGSPNYHHTLSPAEYRAMFSPSAAAYAAVQSYYAGLGLKTLTTPDRLMLGIEGTAGHLSGAFHTGFHNYWLSDGQEVYGTDSPTYVPGWLPIDGVTGMTNAVGPKPAQVSPAEVQAMSAAWKNSAAPSTHSAWSCTSGTQGCDEPGYYGEYPLFNQGDTGTGMSVGIVDAYDSATPQSSLASSESSWTSGAGLPAAKEHFWYPIPGGGNLNASPSSGWGGETDLDQHMVDMTAPGANIDVTFATDSSFAVYEAVDFLVANNLTQTITMSWGEADVGTMYAPPQSPCLAYYSCNASWDGSYAFLHPVFAEAVAEGITPFAAAGDCGAADGTAGVATDYPSSDPFVVGVGGTIPNGTGSVYSGETGWSGNGSMCTSNTGGGGGGWAPFAKPWWQNGPGQLTKNLRGDPDVSTDSSGGTSQASPMWAGWLAVADQIHGGGLGLVGPSMYSILRNSTAYAADFHDIKTGNNGYSAGLGWDPITGIGTPIASALLPALSRDQPQVQGSLNVSLAVTPTSGSAPLTVTLTATATGGSAPYSYDFVPGLDMGEWTSSATLGFTYPTAGVYNAWVEVFDNHGNSSLSRPVLVRVGGSALTTTLSASSTSVTMGQSVIFSGTASGGTAPYAMTYYYGDGSYGYNATTTNSHTYDSAGVFCAYLSVSDAAAISNGGMAGPVCITVTSGANPLRSSATANTSAGDAPLAVQFTGSASGGTAPYTWAWRFGDGGSSTYQNPVHTYNLTGSYTAQLWVNDSAAHSALAYTSLTVNPPIAIATFTASPLTIPLGGTTYLNVSASGGTSPLSYVYHNLPSGCASTNVNSLSCAPSVAGTYTTTTVTVSDANGRNLTSAPVTFQVTSANGPTISAFTALPATLYVGDTLYLNTTVTGGTSPYTYTFTGLPTGCTSSSTPTYTCHPPTAGTYPSVTVTVTDLNSKSAVSSPASVTVRSLPGITQFTIQPSTLPLGGTTYVNTTATGGTGTFTYAFSGMPAGTGCSSANAAFLCVPSTAGTYTVTATVTDTGGRTATSNPVTLVVVSAGGKLAISAFSVSPTTIPLGGTSYVNVSVAGGTFPYTYAYLGLPSGCTSADVAAISCTPSIPGTYPVGVTVTDAVNSRVTASPQTLTVSAPAGYPSVTSFAAYPSTLDVNQSTTFTVQVSGGATPYGYAYTNLPPGCTSSNVASLTCVPTVSGNYTVTVLVTDANGHRVSASTPLEVILPPAPTPPTQSLSSFLGSPIFWVLIATIVAGVVAAVLLTRKKRAPPLSQPPWQAQGYPSQGPWQQPPPYMNSYPPPPPNP